MKRWQLGGVLTALALMASALVATPAWASNCVAFAFGPFKSGTQVYGDGGRHACSTYSTVRVILKRDVPGPDPNLAQRSKQTTAYWRVSVPSSCTYGWTYYTDVRNGAGADKNSTRTRPCGG